jgi:poly(3-hydroxybutyrate) depolymerase
MSKLICMVFMLAVIGAPNVFSANLVERITLNSPIPAAEYQAPYITNDMHQISDYVMHKGDKRSYQFYAAPPDGDKPQPLIILLHGAKRTGASVVHKWMRRADAQGLILVAPDAIDGLWTQSDNMALFDKILQKVDYCYNVDKQRIYLFGHSLGGYLAILSAIRYPQRFAAVAVHAGAMNNYPMLSRLTKTNKTPIVLINGVDDNTVKLKTVEQTAQTLADHGHKTQLVAINDHNHWYYDIADFINQQAWTFMKDYRLE